jgi:GT2 family glycosyltransferase
MTDTTANLKSPPYRGTRLSAVISNYNGMDTLPSTIHSLVNYPLELEEIIVVDDGSTDESVGWLRQHHPEVRVIEMGRNTANLGLVRNCGLRAATGTHVFLTDNDIELLGPMPRGTAGRDARRPAGFLRDPAARLSRRPRHGLPGRPQACISSPWRTTAPPGTASRRGATLAEAGTPPPFMTCGGGIMMLDIALAREIGLFDEGYVHGWGDDGELQLRGILYGYKCLHAAAAMCTHDAQQHGTKRAFGQVHNRFRVFLTFYRARTLLVLAPSLLIFESLLLAASIAGGFFPSYRKAVRETWRGRRSGIAMRREMQRRRKICDGELFSSGALDLPGAVRKGGPTMIIMRLLEMFFSANWRLARLFC